MEAAIPLGLKVAPVNFQEFASDAEEPARLVEYKCIAELPEMNNAALAALIEDEFRGNIDLELAGILKELSEAELKEVKEPVHPQCRGC